MEYLWIGIGGFAGVNARYIVGRWAGNRYGAAFPYGTFLINVTGAFVIGVVMTLLTERFVADPRWRLLIVVGFLGGYTTFSSYAYEAIMLIDQGEWGRSLLYVVGSNVLGLLACLAGVALVRSISTP